MKTTNTGVNRGLSSAANRPIAGTQRGRITAILQQACQAGATTVAIKSIDGMVMVQHDGREVEDFAQLLGRKSSTSKEVVSREDGARIDLSCLAPRRLKMRSGGRFVIIEDDEWTATPVSVHDDPEPCPETVLEFSDEPWTRFAVEPNAVFCSLDVVTDGERCARRPFVTKDAAYHPELGCRIEVRANGNSNRLWSSSADQSQHTVFVNLQGHVVSFAYRPVSVHSLTYLVDLTGEPTGLRATSSGGQLIKNRAFEQLKQAIEMEAFRFLAQRGCHRLPYRQFCRAKKLGVDLPEAVPTLEIGLLADPLHPSPAGITEPESQPIRARYRLNPVLAGDGVSVAANAHILAALGTLKRAFVPVVVHSAYDGYSWADLPTIDKIEVTMGKALLSKPVLRGTLTCVENLVISAHTSDGNRFTSSVPVAVGLRPADAPVSTFDHVFVTPAARNNISEDIFWYHFGGPNEWDELEPTQGNEVDKDLERFWEGFVEQE